MTYLVATIKEFMFGRPKAVDVDPVYRFFYETSSGERKKVYNRALKKAQADQEMVSKKAKAKVRT